jgi:hypothetical protein
MQVSPDFGIPSADTTANRELGCRVRRDNRRDEPTTLSADLGWSRRLSAFSMTGDSVRMTFVSGTWRRLEIS